LVEKFVIGNNDVSALSEVEPTAEVHVCGFESLDFFLKNERVNDDPIADEALNAGMEHAGGDQVEDGLFIANNDGMAGVITALIAGHEIGLVGDNVHDLSLTFVAPLATEHN